MGSVHRNKGPDNEPGNENVEQNKTGRSGFAAEPELCSSFLLVFKDFLRGWACAFQ